MIESISKCSFCGTQQTPDEPLIAGVEGHICESCVVLAGKVIASWGRNKDLGKHLQKPPVPREIKQQLDRYIIGQHEAKETLAVAVYNHYKRLTSVTSRVNSSVNPASAGQDVSSEADVEIEKSNILMLGPSGTGKTLLAKTLARVVGVPFVIADATSLTQAGYVGDDVDSILVRLLEAAEGNRELAECGIVYIDEIDKISRKGGGALGVRDVSGEGVQQALLKIVEGAEVKVSASGRKDSGDAQTLDTHNILFIVGGAFAGMEKLIESRLKPDDPRIGFHAVFAKDEKEDASKEVFGEIKSDDLSGFGLIPEFIGRFPVIATLQALSEEDLVRILTEPRNALVKQYQKLFVYEGIELEFSDEALIGIARQSMERGSGARSLRGIIEGLLKKTMFDAPSERNLKKCIVTDAAVAGEQDVQYEYIAPPLDENRRVATSSA